MIEETGEGTATHDVGIIPAAQEDAACKSNYDHVYIKNAGNLKLFMKMIIKTKISKKEYVKLLYGLTYKKPMILFLLCIAGVVLLWIIGYYTHLLPVPKPTFYQYITLLIITVIQPFTIYRTILKNYNTSRHLKEPLEIECSPECIKVKGETFYTEFTWAKMYKVVELQDWFVIYQNNLSANLIPKKSFLPHQVDEFKQMLQCIPDLRCKLKK